MKKCQVLELSLFLECVHFWFVQCLIHSAHSAHSAHLARYSGRNGRRQRLSRSEVHLPWPLSVAPISISIISHSRVGQGWSSSTSWENLQQQTKCEMVSNLAPGIFRSPLWVPPTNHPPKKNKDEKKRKKYIKDYKKLFNCDQAAQSDRSIYPCPRNNLRSAVFKRCKKRKERKEGWEVKLWKMWKRCEKLQQNERDMWKTYVKHVVKKLCHESRQSNSRVSIESRSPGPNCHDRSSPEGFYRRSWRSIKASTESLNDVSRLYEIIRMMLWPCDLVTLWPCDLRSRLRLATQQR